MFFFCFFSVFSLFSTYLFLTSLLSTPAFSFIHEAHLLYSWLHSSSSPPPSYFSDWNIHDRNPCNWTSITCSPQEFVTEIEIKSVPLVLPLPSNLSSFRFLSKLVITVANLTGNIPSDIGACSALTVIDLSSNNLTGSIPASIGNLQNLVTLALTLNHLSGRIPYEISNCIGLKFLLLSDNHLNGTIPPLLGKLSKLEVLKAGGNKDITGNIPDELGNCSKLTDLGFVQTSISGSLPASLGRLSKLQKLYIYETKLSGKIPPDIGNCSELVDLNLYQNSLSGSIPSELGKLQKLQSLLLWQNGLLGAIPEEIGNCTSLKRLDLSNNSLTGSIPLSIGGLLELEEFMISNNSVSGFIPLNLSNATNLQNMQLDNNQISGLIPPELGMLKNLNLFFAWQNQLEGTIPSTLANFSNLKLLDLSFNALTGSIPIGLFQLQNLTNMILMFNDISGAIPPEIGSCTSLVRLRLGNNRISGEIPKTIGGLKSLNFFDLSRNRLSGAVPDEIGGCSKLEMIMLSNNNLEGPLPMSLSSLSNLQFLDASSNGFSDQIPTSLGHLSSLLQLILGKNSFSGPIPASLGLCSSLQLLDLSSNELTGSIPKELGSIETLAIALNLSHNSLSGSIPSQISKLNKLSVMDISHNMLEGHLQPLSELESLETLNISYNNFTGYLPDTRIFRQLLPDDFMGNRGLCSRIQDSCFLSDAGSVESTRNMKNSQMLKLVIGLLVLLTVILITMGIIAVLKVKRTIRDSDLEMGNSGTWHFTLFQKLNFSIEHVLNCLVDENIIGKGCSGVVYRADIGNNEFIAVKKLRPTTMAAGDVLKHDKSGLHDSFSREVKTLGLIRHKNIVRFLGCSWNRNTRLLMYDYMPNGNLGRLLHERTENPPLEWGVRYQILLCAAQGLEYLHHDCVPPIVHRDIKPNNILIGQEYEACIADFGLAKLLDDGGFGKSSTAVAGSYGYIAPEYGYMMRITERSDVYSFGVVMLEVLTGKEPIDPTMPDGLHIVDWVKQKRGQVEVLDPTLQSAPESEIEEMKQASGIALLCLNSVPNERPTMRDVAAMIKEIKHKREEYEGVDALIKDSSTEISEVPAESSKAQVGASLSQKTKSTNSSAFSLICSSSGVKLSFK